MRRKGFKEAAAASLFAFHSSAVAEFHVAESILVALVVSSVLLFVALLAVLFWWKFVQKLYQETWTRAVVEGVQIVTGVTAIGSAFAAADDKKNWLTPAMAGVACLVLSKAVQLVADWKGKQAKADLQNAADQWKAKAERAETEGVNRTRLLMALRDPVKRKHRRVEKEADTCTLKREGASIRHVRRALLCKVHLEELLFGLAIYLREQLPDAERALHQVRVGLYIAQDGVMVPLYGVSTSDPNYNPFTSYKEHEHFFRLDSPSHTAHAVQCVRDKTTIVIPDCADAKAKGKLIYFTDSQPTYLKSLAAFYIGKVCGPRGQACDAALVLDASKNGFFRKEDAASLQFTVDEFASRILLELSLIALVFGNKRKADGNFTEHPGASEAGQTSRAKGEGASQGNEA